MLMLSTIALLDVSVRVEETHNYLEFQVAGYGKLSPNHQRVEDFLTLGILLLGVAGYIYMVRFVS